MPSFVMQCWHTGSFTKTQGSSVLGGVNVPMIIVLMQSIKTTGKWHNIPGYCFKKIAEDQSVLSYYENNTEHCLLGVGQIDNTLKFL